MNYFLVNAYFLKYKCWQGFLVRADNEKQALAELLDFLILSSTDIAKEDINQYFGNIHSLHPSIINIHN